MKPAPFRYHRASSLEDALAVLAERGDEVTVLAGGQSLVPMMNLRLARPEYLLDIFHLEQLRGLHGSQAGLTVGAGVTQRRLEQASDATLGSAVVLREAAAQVGHFPVRTRGTVGGSIAHGDAAAEMPLIAVLLEAQVELRSATHSRMIPAGEFFQGFLQTARRDDELLTAIRFPSGVGTATFIEHARQPGDFGLVLVGVYLEADGTTCRSIRIAVGGVGAVPLRLTTLESQLTDVDLDAAVIKEAAGEAAASVEPPSDDVATAAYRRALVENLVGAALRTLTQQAAPQPAVEAAP